MSFQESISKSCVVDYFGIPGVTGNPPVGEARSFYDTTDGKFHIIDSTGATVLPAGAANSLSGLSDVSLSSPTNNQVLTYNSGTGKWVNATPTSTLAGLTDVTISSPLNAQVLTYNTGAAKWENAAIPAQALSGLSDVTIATPLNNQVLTYNTGASKWENAAVPTTPATRLRALNTTWINQSSANSASIQAVGQRSSTSPNTSSASSAFNNATGTTPPYVSFTSSASATHFADVVWPSDNTGVFQFFTAFNFQSFIAYCGQDSTTLDRFWVGMVDTGSTNPGTAMSSDTPAQNVVAFRFSPSAEPSGNFKAYVGTDASHQTVADTGVLADTAFHIFEITYDGTTYTFYIDSTQVAAIATNKPAATVAYNWFINVDNMGAANAVTLKFVWMAITMK